MDVTPLISSDSNVIQSYGSDGFKISGNFYEGSLIVTVDQIVSWPVAGPDSLDADSFRQILPAKDMIDVILLGTGKTFIMPPRDLRETWKDYGLRIEVMDTGAACRTYNILMAENRRVAAALLTA